MDVYSIRFQGCRTVYPCQIVRPLGKYKYNQKRHLDNFLTNVCRNECVIEKFVGDCQKRVTARDGMGHAAYFPCEYCTCKGTLFYNFSPAIIKKKEHLLAKQIKLQTKIDNLNGHDSSSESDGEMESLLTELQTVTNALKDLHKNKKGNIRWPKTSFRCEPRTRENIIEISDKIENNEKLTKDECKGITGRSLFLDIPYFDIIGDIPAEYLHSTCLGVTKRMLELTFDIGETRARITKRKLSSPKQFNHLMLTVLVPYEFSRRTKSLDFNVMKGQQFRNICIFFFPIIINCIERSAKERRIWLLFAFMIRSCIVPASEFEQIDIDSISTACYDFYDLYENVFGVINCTYNTHVVISHLLQIRGNSPLTVNSAFGFESFYGEIRNCFVPGTPGPLKQIMSKVLIKRIIGPHCCEMSIKYSSKNTQMERNNLIYTFNDNQYKIFEIKEMSENHAQCQKINIDVQKFDETPELNWSKVGVFKEASVAEQIHNIPLDSIQGKVIKIDDILITCPNNILREK